jgi:hypothetical protein
MSDPIDNFITSTYLPPPVSVAASIGCYDSVRVQRIAKHVMVYL